MKNSVCTLCNFVVVIGNLFTFLFFNYFSLSKKKMRKWSEYFHLRIVCILYLSFSECFVLQTVADPVRSVRRLCVFCRSKRKIRSIFYGNAPSTFLFCDKQQKCYL